MHQPVNFWPLYSLLHFGLRLSLHAVMTLCEQLPTPIRACLFSPPPLSPASLTARASYGWHPSRPPRLSRHLQHVFTWLKQRQRCGMWHAAPTFSS